MTPDSCRPVEVTVDGQTVVMRVQGARVPTEDDLAALEQLATAAVAKMRAQSPHAGLIQELIAAWMSVRRQMPANDSPIGRRSNVAAVKQRMSDAIAAVREALERAS